MRICFVSSDYIAGGPPGSGGGIETYVRTMACGLAAAGHDVHVVARAAGRTASSSSDGVHVHGIAVPDDWNGAGPALGEARAALSFAWHARRKVRQLTASVGRFDIVETPEYGAQGFFLADDGDIPLVVKCHAHLLLCLAFNGVPLTPATALLADLEGETLRKARAIHANSRALADRCAADYGVPRDRFALVPYGIDTNRFRPTPSRLRAQYGLEDKRILLFVGRMEARKGIVTLVRAFADVAAALPDTVLLLAGADLDGPPGRFSNIAWMCEQWEALGVPGDRYLFLGNLPSETLPAVYSAADLMVAPSPFEAFGFVYLESMACGCPPIGCRAGGAVEVIAEGQTGVLVPPDDPSTLARTLIEVLNAPALRARLAACGARHVARQYTLDAVIGRTLRFYEEVSA
jgi:glycosyltransferase involved in cell wall biosynthesis